MVSIDFDSFEDLALDRLQYFWEADEFEIKVFEDWLQSFYGCNIGNLKCLIDNFHVNNFSEIEQKEYKKLKEEGYYVYSNEEEGRYAVVY